VTTHELIIIGAGPAGITAAVYAARKKMDCIVISGDIGGQAAWSGDVENYTGNLLISGPELAMKFEEHLRQYPLEVHDEEQAVSIEQCDDLFTITTSKSKYRTRSVIIATGKRAKKLDVPGELEYRNKGVAYCAICDGPLFAGRDVAVIGGGNSALDATLQLINIANRIYLINTAEALTGDLVMQDKIQQSDKVEIFNRTEVLAIKGAKMVTGLTASNPAGVLDIAVQGIFVEIGLIPNADFVQDVKKNELGEILVDCQCSTNIPGIFAAGDVTDVHDKQIIIAAGEGAKASLAAYRYLLRTA